MSPPTVVEPAELRSPRSWRRRLQPLRALGVAASIAAFVALGHLIEQPRFVPSIRITNPTAYDLSIEVTGADDDGWMPVWIAERHAVTVAEDIYDIGDTWIFRFSAQGETTGELRVDRASLERTGWRLHIPDRIADELRVKGALPPP